MTPGVPQVREQKRRSYIFILSRNGIPVPLSWASFGGTRMTPTLCFPEFLQSFLKSGMTGEFEGIQNDKSNKE